MRSRSATCIKTCPSIDVANFTSIDYLKPGKFRAYITT